MSLLWLLPIALATWLITGGPGIAARTGAAMHDRATSGEVAQPADLDALLDTVERPDRPPS